MPCGRTLEFGNDRIRVTQNLAISRQLTGNGDVALLSSLLAVTNGVYRGRCQADDQNHEERDKALPSAHGAVVRMVAGLKEALFRLAERRVAYGVGADPGGCFGGGFQEVAAVEVRRIVGVPFPVGGDALQPGTDDTVRVVF